MTNDAITGLAVFLLVVVIPALAFVIAIERKVPHRILDKIIAYCDTRCAFKVEVALNAIRDAPRFERDLRFGTVLGRLMDYERFSVFLYRLAIRGLVQQHLKQRPLMRGHSYEYEYTITEKGRQHLDKLVRMRTARR